MLPNGARQTVKDTRARRTARRSRNTTYRGRFAPSPTGPLHFGSLATAVASYLQARAHRGEWLLRIEDIDPPREAAGAASGIIDALSAYGFEWDGSVRFQSERLERYEDIVRELLARGDAYPCACSRRVIRATAIEGLTGPVYPGTCRGGISAGGDRLAVRVRTGSAEICFEDRLQGRQCCQMEAEIGDYLVRRADGLIAYQLAVVADDHEQGITEVVRGADLLEATFMQVHLQDRLGYARPLYMHLPVATDNQGTKLSKQTGAQPVGARECVRRLLECLRFLRQQPPESLARGRLGDVWAWAIEHWNPAVLASCRETVAPPGAWQPDRT